MKRVYQSADFYSAQLIKSYLEDNGIEANVTGEMLIGAIGEIPANSYPSVWVLNSEDYDRAKQLIEQYENKVNSQSGQSYWTCPQCQETIEDQFSQCWNCGALRPNQ